MEGAAMIVRMALAWLVAAMLALAPAAAQQQRGESLPLIRDAEIEGLLRTYAKPIFQSAGIKPGSVHVYLINQKKINAFVAGGQRIFVNTGLLMQAKTPNEVIGVLAHETGHLAGGHLARLGIELDRLSTVNILGTLAGVAAAAGGIAASNAEAAQAGQGIMAGTAGLSQRLLTRYQRQMEASADQAAIKYLTSTGQSGLGMLTLFQKLSTQSIASLRNVDPYVLSHPMPMDRLRNLEVAVKGSKFYAKADKPELVLRHKLMQAKLIGFLEPAQTVFQRYPKSNDSLPARYARAIALFRSGDTRNAIPVIDGLIEDLPQNPYFWELKGQALIEGGKPAAAIEPSRRAVKLLPNNGLLKLQLAQALLGTETKANAEAALAALKSAKTTEGDMPRLHQYMAMAYGILGDIPRADLATAEAAYLRGDKELAVEKSRVVAAKFKRGSPEWTRANDILNFAEAR
jgi:predicted Zn-dependent protease